jgi:uncharacterized protein with PQ loop repeat
MNEFSSPGLNQATVSTIGCIVMTLLGAYGQKSQIEKIWKNKKVTNVSSSMSIILFTLFGSYLVRGIAEEKVMYLAQGIIRTILFIPILLGIIRFGEFTKKDWCALGLGILTLFLMYTFDSIRVEGFVTIMHIGLLGATHQAWKVRKTNGQVSFAFYFTMFLSVAFQSWYGWYFKDFALLVPCLGFSFLYLSILGLMIRNSSKNTVVAR